MKMKKLIAIVMMLLPMLAWGQNTADSVWFDMQPDGMFLTKDGKGFAVVEYEGKTAHELYQMIASNISSAYNDPSQVMSGVEDTSIKVRAYCASLVQKKMIFTFNGGGYYQLEFKFKDGRIRVNAPYIEREIVYDSQPPQYANFYDIVAKWFKKGELKKGDRVKYEVLNLTVNSFIQVILNPSAGNKDANEDW